MGKSFSNIEEIRTEINALKVQIYQRESAIQQRFSSPAAVFKTIGSLFKSDNKKSFFEDLIGQDIITNTSRVLLPLLLNHSLFRKSSFITKTLVTIFSQKAAEKVDLDFLSAVLEKIEGLFNKTGAKSAPDYGIPPDSETY
jgi:hypothetical protein